MGKILHFRQLEVWQEVHTLVLMVYQATKRYPGDERYGLVSQMRRTDLMAQSETVGRLLNGLIASTERRQ